MWDTFLGFADDSSYSKFHLKMKKSWPHQPHFWNWKLETFNSQYNFYGRLNVSAILSILTSLLQYNYINVLYHTIESCDVRYLCTYRQLHHLKKNTFLWDKNNPIFWKYFPIRFFPLRFANCLKFRMLTTLCRRDLVPLTQVYICKGYRWRL